MNGREAPAESVQTCVRDILASRVFSRSGRLRAFLEYVVECELAGKAGQLKGYTIGIDVFGRPAGFDAGSDPIVRVQAGKLRKLLEEYYAGEGANAPLRIRIPTGSYVPEYEMLASSKDEPAKPEPAPAPPAPDRMRKRNAWRRRWRPAPVSSYLALLTLLPLFVLAPASYPRTALTAIADAKFSVEASRTEADLGGALPSLRIKPCPPGNSGCREFARAITNAAGYYRTIRLGTEVRREAGPLSYTIRVEPGSKRDTVYARLVHDESGETIHAERFRAGELDDQMGAAYEAVAFADRILSVNGRIYLHAMQSGTVSSMMTCLREADRQRLSGGVSASCQSSPLVETSGIPVDRASQSGSL